MSGESEHQALWFQFTWGSATQFCFHFALSCEFPLVLSSISGVLVKCCRDSFEIVQWTATTLGVLVHDKNQGLPSVTSRGYDHFLSISRRG